MKTLKILFVYNRYKKVLDTKKVFADGIKHIEQNFPFKIETEDMLTNFDFRWGELGNHKFKGVIPMYQDLLEKLNFPAKYSHVVFLDDGTPAGIRVGTAYQRKINNAHVIYVHITKDNGNVFNHEWIHSCFADLREKGIELHDPMDLYHEHGQEYSYHNDKDMFAKNSNRTKAIEILKPYFDVLFNNEPIKTVSAGHTKTSIKMEGLPQNNFPNKIIVHHTGGSDSKPLADTSHHTAQMVEAYHESLGWDGIGYHYFIEKNGDVYFGRPEYRNGAHTLGQNTQSIGVCLAGNFDATLPTEAQINSLKALLKKICEKNNIPKSEIYPHRAFDKTKTCYGTKLGDDWARSLLKDEQSIITPDNPSQNAILTHIRAIQQILGVKDDGIVGKQTLEALKAQFPQNTYKL